MTDFVRSIRHAFRTLSNSLPTTVVIVGTLGVAMGMVCVIFSVIDLVWHIIPVQRSDRLVFVASTDSRRGQAQAGLDVVARPVSAQHVDPGRGGSLSVAGPVIVGGILYTTSGYGLFGAMPGNMFLAFCDESGAAFVAKTETREPRGLR